MTTTTNLMALSRVRALSRSGSARALRHNAGLTLSEVADAVGVSPRSVHRWETGKNAPTGEPALRYGELLQALMQEASR